MSAPLHLLPGGLLPGGPAPEGRPRPARALHAIARVSYGPVPLDFDRLAAEFPAVQSGLALAGEVDLELRLACTGLPELRAVAAALHRAGAARVRIDLVLRALTPAPVTLRPVP
ncbi:hypothetical protein BX285_6061 [Streptomyces sp. 1114.5]|uniref:hypothetical protein n=1 Tax=unclassified Streptomyces TaxID=2593676 RepID=UPI000BCBDE7E|nr:MULTISPECIES: hypothetical protein [unclassified Streptomyces]RKT12095.1 hypothetical protein BX285_6061 [Streptomyces sp. 1114.5]SOB79893.1 hypothetical protein SAMN06272789_0665 [Streptomyces sp. 1331.2]